MRWLRASWLVRMFRRRPGGTEQPAALSFDPDRQVLTRVCDCCGGVREVVTGLVYRNELPHAVYFASCYPDQRECWIDIIIGTQWEEEGPADHVTFGCRVGAVEGSASPGCSLVQAAQALEEPSDLLGTCLDRDGALAHPWLNDFWDVVDFVLIEDPTVSEFMHSH